MAIWPCYLWKVATAFGMFAVMEYLIFIACFGQMHVDDTSPKAIRLHGAYRASHHLPADYEIPKLEDSTSMTTSETCQPLSLFTPPVVSYTFQV